MTLTIIIALPGLSMRSQAVSTADMRSWCPLAAGAGVDGLLRAKVPPAGRPVAGALPRILAKGGAGNVDRNTYAP
jgi:hypothetical protein